MISHITRALANSDREKPLTGVNTPLTAEAGVIGIRVVPEVATNGGAGNCSPNIGIKGYKPFQLCVIRVLF